MKHIFLLAGLLLCLLIPFASAKSCLVVLEYDLEAGMLVEKEMRILDSEPSARDIGGNIYIIINGSEGELYNTTAEMPLLTSISRPPGSTSGGAILPKNTSEIQLNLPLYEDAQDLIVEDANGIELFRTNIQERIRSDLIARQCLQRCCDSCRGELRTDPSDLTIACFGSGAECTKCRINCMNGEDLTDKGGIAEESNKTTDDDQSYSSIAIDPSARPILNDSEIVGWII